MLSFTMRRFTPNRSYSKIILNSESFDVLNPKEVSDLKILKKQPKVIKQEEFIKIPKWTTLRMKKGTWKPINKLSRESMEELRELHKKDPVENNFSLLSKKFNISNQAIKKILKSKFDFNKIK
jgi:hypothetical protein